ncbi:serine hydrolase domain-containing protein [soil metagenome]
MPDRLLTNLIEPFERNFRECGELGASVSVFVGDQEVLNLSQGYADREQTRPWTAETLVPVWSATKGPAALSCLLALEEAGVSLESPVAEVWPEFAASGKQEITLRVMLAHGAGLAALDSPVPMHDYQAVIKALEDQSPVYAPHTKQAYHARTFGFLLEEIVRRLSHADSLGQYFHERIARPMGLDFWIGLPPEQLPRVATLYPGKMTAGVKPDAFLQSFLTRGTLTQRAFASPTGLNAIQDMNKPETLAQGYASMGGVSTARALAAFYGMLSNQGVWNGQKLVSDAILLALESTQTQDVDGVLCSPIGFSAGLMRDAIYEHGEKIRPLLGRGLRAFGHPGAGGSLAFGDPERKLSFAYVMNQMTPGALPGGKALSLVAALDAAM